MMAVEDAITSLRRLLKAIIRSQNPFYVKKLRAAGLDDFEDLSIEDFTSRCPFTIKDEIAADHIVNPPFGSNLGRPISEYVRISKTSGTTGGPGRVLGLRRLLSREFPCCAALRLMPSGWES
jgi:phenylacetate-coenzyme A ligase PaaK-like adenylate-forming protein